MPAHRKPLEIVQDRRPERLHGRAAATGDSVAPQPAPKPPKGLLRPAQATWNAFWESDVARAIDRQADGFRLVRWITAVSEWYRVSRVFQQARLVRGSTGQPALNPLAAYLSTLETTIARAEAEFGMTPLSRNRLGLTIAQVRLTAEAVNRALREEPDADEYPELGDYEPA